MRAEGERLCGSFICMDLEEASGWRHSVDGWVSQDRQAKRDSPLPDVSAGSRWVLNQPMRLVAQAQVISPPFFYAVSPPLEWSFRFKVDRKASWENMFQLHLCDVDK